MGLDLQRVAASAELLHERVRNDHAADAAEASSLEGTVDPSVVEDLRTQFDAEFDSLDEYVAFERWPADEPVPDWASAFQDLYADLTDRDGGTDVPSAFAEVPFVDVLWPVVARERARAFDGGDHLTDAAWRDLEAMLLEELVDVSAQALHVDFYAFVEERTTDTDEGARRSPDSRERYEAYVRAFFDGRMDAFFAAYGMVPRLLAVTVRQWRTATGAFLSRLDEDFSALRTEFGVAERDRVTGLTPAGDAHDGGKRVMLLEFESGVELVYKPRNVEPEQHLYGFEDWLARTCPAVPDLRTPNCLPRASYGWVEKVEPGTFDSIDDLAEYYRGAGALLAVAYVLNMSDCHLENVVATAPSPTLVDAETVFEEGAAPARATDADVASRLTRYVLTDTVLGTQLLPFGTGVDNFAGLGLHEKQEASIPELSWIDVNTDAMDVEYVKRTKRHEGNLPKYDGDLVPPDRFVDEVVDGFESTYAAVTDRREAVKRRISSSFEGVSSRMVLRNTRAYYTLLKTLTNPEYLRDGVRYGYKLQEMLSRREPPPQFLSNTKMRDLGDEQWDAIVGAERQSIQRQDVPKFTVYTDDAGLYYDGDRLVSSLTRRSGLERAAEKIDDLSEDDGQFQTGLIRACLADRGRRIEAHPGGFP